MTVGSPEPLADHHDLEHFNSGVQSLDDWLKRRARGNQSSGASRTFVATENEIVAGYYALAASSVAPNETAGRFRRNMPDPIPVVVLARLAIDQRFQGAGLGSALVRDCAMRVVAAADTIGIRGMMVHAISEEARTFYLRLGFDPSPVHPMLLTTTLGDLRAFAGL
jgi:GNAT superfamily N-acetyltransferase